MLTSATPLRHHCSCCTALSIASIHVIIVAITVAVDAAASGLRPCATTTRRAGNIAELFGNDLWESKVDWWPQRVQDLGYVQARSFTILLFFMVWGFILQNIFTGLIASAFEAIRDERLAVQEDSQTSCLVCSLDQYTLNQRTRGGFEDHLSM